jgi:predicted metal-dependent enzyme (double-stranded beta helix superfamily)
MTVHAPLSAAPDLARLRTFIAAISEIVEHQDGEAGILAAGGALLKDLIAVDDWLPQDYARPGPDYYRQYLLHCDSRERFSIVSFVWGPGQATPIHDHTVWGLVGVLRGAERVESFRRGAGGDLSATGETILHAGEVDAVSPTIGDIHRVTNAAAGVSISIHVYGANIGAVCRATYAADGAAKPFISGYANPTLPNIWDRSRTDTPS